MVSWVDTHVHWYFPDFQEDLETCLKQAQAAGVQRFINVGTDIETSRASLKLAEQYPFIWASAGVHPHDAEKATPEELKQIAELLNHPRMVAIGEVGLDFFRQHSGREAQLQIFEHFLTLQTQIKKPLIIHCRDAYEEMLEVLKSFGQKTYSGVMHCFSSNARIMEKFVDFGFHISFAGPLTYKKNDELREACRLCPEERLLLETDAPFLPPEGYRGKRNESSYMAITASTAAEVRKVSLEALSDQTTRNACQLFKL